MSDEVFEFGDDFVVDLTEVKDPPDGNYKLLIEELKTHMGKPSTANPQGLPMANVTFVVQEDDAGNAYNTKIWQYLGLKGGSARLIKQILIVTDFITEDEETPHVNLLNLVGQQVWGFVKLQAGKDGYPPKLQVSSVSTN